MCSLHFESWNTELLEENLGNTLLIGIGKDFPFVQELSPTNDKWDFLKLQCFCTAKITGWRGIPQTERQSCVSCISDVELVWKLQNELKKDLFKIWPKTWIEYSKGTKTWLRNIWKSVHHF